MDCCCCCCERERGLSDIGEKDSGRLPLPSLEENDGVDNRESEDRFIFIDSFR